MDIIVRSFLAFGMSLALFILIGYLLFRYIKRPSFANLFEATFWYSLSGLLFSVSLYAIAVTGFKTILLIVPLLVFFLIRTAKSENANPWRHVRKSFLLLFLLVASLLYTSFYLQAFISGDTQSMNFAAGDHLYYARVAEYLNITGIETYNFDYFFREGNAALPYHYGDLWLSAFISYLTGIQTEFVLLLVVYPLLATITAVGIGGYLLKRFSQKNFYWLLFALLFFFFSGLSFLYPTFLKNHGTLDFALSQRPKTLWIGCFLIATLSLAAEKKLNTLLIIVALASITFINMLPAFTLSAFLLIIVMSFKREVRITDSMHGIFILIGSLTYYLLFYTFQAESGSESVDLVPSSYYNQKNMRTAINIIIGTNFHSFLLIPVVVLCIYNARVIGYTWVGLRRIILKPEMLWLNFLFFSGILAYSAASLFTVEAVQFFYNVLIPLVSIITAIALFWVITVQKVYLKVMGVGLAVTMIMMNYRFQFHIDKISHNEWQQLKRFVSDTPNPVFVNYKSKNEFANEFDKNTRFLHPVPAFNYLFNPYINESLNTTFLLQDSLHYSFTEKQALRSSSFFHYTTSASLPLNTEQNKRDALLGFMEMIKADYIMVSGQTTLPSYIRASVKDSLLVTGWTLYKIKQHNRHN